MLRAAERPIIVSSNGVFYRRGWNALKRLAEKAQIPVVESGAMKGPVFGRASAVRQRGSQRTASLGIPDGGSVVTARARS